MATSKISSLSLNQNSAEEEKKSASNLEDIPEELWETIFDKVTDPQDWLNLSRTNSRIQTSAKKQRTLALFPDVLRHIEVYLRKRDVLNCRLVCRKWKTAVDQKVESELDNPEIINQRITFRYWYEFYNAKNISKFTQDMEQHPGNPFVGKSIRFDTQRDGQTDTFEKLQDYFKGSIELLKKFGKFIRFLAIENHSSMEATKDEILKTTIWFIECLRLVPNLELLYIFHTSYTEYGMHDNIQKSVLAYVKDNPIPKLEKLERLSVSALEGIESIWKNICIPRKVKQVDFPEFPIFFPKSPVVLAREFPNIDLVNVGKDKEKFSPLQGSRWPLKVLIIEDLPTQFTRRLFPKIEKFGNTLTKVKLLFPLQMDELWNHGITLTLPNVKEIHLVDLTVNLSFLRCPNLEEITLGFQSPINQKVYEGQEKPYDWNKWYVFPKLRKLRFLTRPSSCFPVEKRIYRREMFEYLKVHMFRLRPGVAAVIAHFNASTRNGYEITI